MKLGIDISQIVYRGSGVARFTEGLTRAICEDDRGNEWHFFLSSLRNNLQPELTQLIKRRNFFLHRYYLPPTFLAILWNNWHVGGIEHFTGELDWFITSDWTEPPADCKKATIIHDFVYQRYPETAHDKTSFEISSLNIAPNIVDVQKSRHKRVQKESDVIFVDSASTGADAETYLGVEKKRIVVNYPGVTRRDIDPKTPINPSVVRPFILSVGKREPRKNLDRLIEAYRSLNTIDIDLVIVGDTGWGDHTMNRNRSGHIHFLGYVSDDELIQLYMKCLICAYPSIWEGFGYPVIEAMTYGAPVATSKTSSLGEIAHGHAVLFDPANVKDIAHVMERLIADEKLRKRLSEKGKIYAATFTWKRYYTIMIQTLQNAKKLEARS